MPYDPTEDPNARRFSDWIRQGRCEGLVDEKCQWVSGKGQATKDWLDRGRKSGVLLLAGELASDDKRNLQNRFLVVVSFLLAVMACAVFGVSRATSPLLVSIVAGLLGSAIAAFISCLNRRANGFEDSQGNTFPDPFEKKERFGQSMSYWLICRPFLGAAMGAIAYWGMVGGVFISADKAKDFPSQLEKVAFIGSIAGLFAKTLYDILQNVLKSAFKT